MRLTWKKRRICLSSNSIKDITGRRYGKLVVIKRDEEKSKEKKRAYWICRCDCDGKLISVRADNLGIRTSSCGCLQKEAVSKYCKNNYTKNNQYDLSGEHGIGYTLNGIRFFFDKEDFWKIKDKCWYISKAGYLYSKRKTGTFLMHRVIMELPEGCKDVVDHLNHNPLDNRKNNLRVTTQGKNCYNKSKQSNNTSGCPGVTFDKSKNKWVAFISYARKNIFIGRYDKYEDAVTARKRAEEKYFGEYSYSNSMSMTLSK